MTISSLDLVLVTVVAVLTPLVLLWTAPSWSAGMQRLKFIANSLGKVLIVVPTVIGAGLIAWGVAAGSKEIVYAAILPFIFAYMMSDLARH